MRGKYQKPRGFTLIELTVVIVILGLLYAIVIPKFEDITGLKLKSTTRKIASLIKYTYDDSVSKNKKMRLVFDFGESNDQIWIEEWIEKTPKELLSLKIKENDDEETLTVTEKEELENAPKGEFSPVSEKLAKKFILPDYVKIKGIYLVREDRMIDRDSLGKAREKTSKDESPPVASIVFLPSGYTENSIVYLSDLKERVYSIKINPITGRPTVFDSYEEPGKL